MTTQKPEPVAVEQGDRDAAMELCSIWDTLSFQHVEEFLASHRLTERARLTTDRSVGAVPDGWKLVPAAPTSAMVAVGERAAWDDDNHMPAINMVPAIYAAMIAATPPVPAITEPDYNGNVPNRYVPDLPSGCALFAVNPDTEAWHYVNHAGTWQGMPNPLVPAISGEGEKLREAIDVRKLVSEALGDHQVGNRKPLKERLIADITAALATPDAASIGSDDAGETVAENVTVQIPADMKPWTGGARAPDDWDRGPVLFRDGKLVGAPAGYVWKLGWGHHYGNGDVIAYTPKASDQ